MSPKFTALVAAVTTGCGATVIGAFTTTPEMVTQLIVGTTAFMASGIVLLVLFCTPWLRAVSAERQRRVIWFAAVSTGALICLLPLALLLFRQ